MLDFAWGMPPRPSLVMPCQWLPILMKAAELLQQRSHERSSFGKDCGDGSSTEFVQRNRQDAGGQLGPVMDAEFAEDHVEVVLYSLLGEAQLGGNPFVGRSPYHLRPTAK
jgi:hypothetical protein